MGKNIGRVALASKLVYDGSPFEVSTLRLKRLLPPIDLASRIEQIKPLG